MSTRGCVAVRQEDGSWKGVYNHYDSYPAGLGEEVKKACANNADHLQEFCDEMLKYGDWRDFRDGGVCEYCGKTGLGQPVNINSSGTHDHAGYTLLTPATAAEAWIEWIYIIDPKKRVIDVIGPDFSHMVWPIE